MRRWCDSGGFPQGFPRNLWKAACYVFAMGGKRILVVEDEPDIAEVLQFSLDRAGFQVEVERRGDRALETIRRQPPDLVVLDLMLPGRDGLSMLREIRAWSDVPVIVLSARGEEATKIEALDQGADDYLTKPFGIGELLARVRALMRRGKESATPVIDLGEVRIDGASHRVTRCGKDVHLTPTEYDLLLALARNRGKLMTHRQLLKDVWGSYATENVQQLRVYISYLRTKLEANPHAPVLIVTEPGVGYRLVDELPARS